MNDVRAEAAAQSLMEQTDFFSLKALEAIAGARGDVAAFALLTVAFAATRHYLGFQVSPENVEPMLTELIDRAIAFGRNYSKELVAEGLIRFSDTVRTHERSDAEKRLLGIPSEGEADG